LNSIEGASPETTGRRLASIIVVAYRQEKFVRAAVRSALAQTYAPLEIILSDDCSPDRTFEIMQEEAEAYRGPHKLILNRNPTNLGVAQHYSRAAELASGEIIVIQDGDDISAPHRTSRLVEAFFQPTPVDMVCSNVLMIDQADQARPAREAPPVTPLTLEAAIAQGSISALGCACAYSRALWTKYGPIDPEVLQEDVVMPFRALLERGIRVLDEPLLQYRIHGDNLFGGRPPLQSREKRRRWARSWFAISRDWEQAWVRSGRKNPELERQLRRLRTHRQYDAECYDRSRAYALLISLRALAGGLTLRNFSGLFRRHVLRLV
jgi:glycosyltransferase involved in cell wall biosynthesis